MTTTCSNVLVKTITGVPGIEGVAYIPEGKKLYTSNWYENKIGIVDLTQLAVIKKIPTADKPDGIAVFQADDPEHVRKIEDFPVERKVHNLAVDVNTRRVYAPEEEEGGRPVARMVVFDALIGASSDRQ